MTIKGGFIGLVVIVFGLTFLGAGEVGATQCYNLYYNSTCVFDYLKTGTFDSNWGTWAFIRIALHKDMLWESYNNILSGQWMVFGNSIYFYVDFANSQTAPAPFINKPMLAGVKTGAVKFVLSNPPKSKLGVSRAQGFFQVAPDTIPGCWYLAKVSNDQCPWIME